MSTRFDVGVEHSRDIKPDIIERIDIRAIEFIRIG